MARRTKNRDAPSKEPSPERQVAFRLGPSWRGAGAAWVGEVDIVARRRQVLVFVEVKARARLDDAAENVTERQQRRFAAAASA